MTLCEGNDDNRYRAGGSTDHPRPTAQYGGNDTHDKSGVQAGQRGQAGQKGKSHRLGHQGQGYRQTGQNLDFVVDLLLEIEEVNILFHLANNDLGRTAPITENARVAKIDFNPSR